MRQVIDVETMDSKLLSLNKDIMFHKCYCYSLFEILVALLFIHVDIVGWLRSLSCSITGDSL